MKKTCGLTCLFFWAAMLFCSVSYAQQYDPARVSVKYMDGRPKSRGTLLAASDSSIRLIVKTRNPAHRADPKGRHRRRIIDTLTLGPQDIARLRMRFESSKKRVAVRTLLALVTTGAVGGFIAGVQSDQRFVSPNAMGVAGALVFSGFGFMAGIPLGFIVNDFMKKKYTVNGSRENYRKLLPARQGYQGRER